MNPLARRRVKAQMARNNTIEAEMRQRAAVDMALADRMARRERQTAVLNAIADVTEAYGAQTVATIETLEQ